MCGVGGLHLGTKGPQATSIHHPPLCKHNFVDELADGWNQGAGMDEMGMERRDQRGLDGRNRWMDGIGRCADGGNQGMCGRTERVRMGGIAQMD